MDEREVKLVKDTSTYQAAELQLRLLILLITMFEQIPFLGCIVRGLKRTHRDIEQSMVSFVESFDHKPTEEV